MSKNVVFFVWYSMYYKTWMLMGEYGNLANTLHYHIKRYKSCHWDGNFSKGTYLYLKFHIGTLNVHIIS